MAGYRPCYTVDEDIKIIRYIIETQAYYLTRGKSFWEDLENEGIVDRTWQSMKERYEKHILPRINDARYTISAVEKKNLQLADYQLKNRFFEKKSLTEEEIDYSNSDEDAGPEDSDSNKDEVENGQGKATTKK